MTQLPMLYAENSNEVTLTLTDESKGTKVSTCCCRSVIVKFPKEGSTPEQQKDNPAEYMLNFPVAEVYETTVEGNEIKTIPMESLE